MNWLRITAEGNPLVEAYRAERALGWHARTAHENAKTRLAWENLDGRIVGDQDRDQDEVDAVRLRICPEMEVYDDSYIDTWADLSEGRRERIKADLHERINRDGCWGVVGEYWGGESWEHADSCWGFVGEDWRDSGYDTDIMHATIQAYNAREFCSCCGRPMQKTEGEST